jgi:hypothetical protein
LTARVKQTYDSNERLIMTIGKHRIVDLGCTRPPPQGRGGGP